MDTASAAIETPSGKSAGDENFPVGSFLLPKRLRPHVALYYAFARAIDDIADNPDLAPDEKIARLDAMDQALLGKDDGGAAVNKARKLRASMLETHVDLAHARDLISAFKQDAVQNRYANWAELIDYCDRSASPVGRYLLELHGESRDGFRFSDALCNALQVINHLQDCADDYREMDRVYLPLDWMSQAGTSVEALGSPMASAGLRRVIDECLDGTKELLQEADRLPGALTSRGLAMESAAIVKIAWALTDKLSRLDPLATRVKLTKPQYLLCGLSGVISVLTGR